MLVLDLGDFHRRNHVVKFREALLWSAMWIALAAVLAVLVYFWLGRGSALEFAAGFQYPKITKELNSLCAVPDCMPCPCSSCSWWLRLLTCCLRSIPFPQSWPSRSTPSSCTPQTCLPFLGCDPCTSPWPE